MAEPSRKNNKTAIPSDLSGLGVHVLDRSVNSHREASSPRLTACETHTVASQKQLVSTRITRKGHSNSQVPTPRSTMVAGGKQCQPLHPIKHALQIFTDTTKEGWSAHLDKHTARGTWLLLESKLHINCLELKSVFLALKEFQDLCSDKIILRATDKTTVVSYIN